MSDPLAQLRPLDKKRTILLTSYRKDGTPVGTPVNIAIDNNDHAVIRTWTTTGKYKRLMRNPEVEVAPSTVRGNPTGPAVHAHVRLLEGNESEDAAKALARKYPIIQGVLVPRVHKLRGLHTVHFELLPDGGEARGASGDENPAPLDEA